jgi:hypothetical protein
VWSARARNVLGEMKFRIFACDDKIFESSVATHGYPTAWGLRPRISPRIFPPRTPYQPAVGPRSFPGRVLVQKIPAARTQAVTPRNTNESAQLRVLNPMVAQRFVFDVGLRAPLSQPAVTVERVQMREIRVFGVHDRVRAHRDPSFRTSCAPRSEFSDIVRTEIRVIGHVSALERTRSERTPR